MVDISLEQFGEYLDDAGRQIAPFIERGSDNIPTAIPRLTPEDLRSLGELDSGEHMQLLTQFGIIDTPDKLLERNAEFLARYNITPTDTRYEQELQRLLDSGSGRVLLEQARRTAERYETLSSIDGDTQTNMIYLAEGDNPCPECAALNGTEGSYAELVASDQVPGSRCLGGDACQCALVPID